MLRAEHLTGNELVSFLRPAKDVFVKIAERYEPDPAVNPDDPLESPFRVVQYKVTILVGNAGDAREWAGPSLADAALWLAEALREIEAGRGVGRPGGPAEPSGSPPAAV